VRLLAVGFLCRGEIKRVLWEWSAYDRFQWFISNCSVFECFVFYNILGNCNAIPNKCRKEFIKCFWLHTKKKKIGPPKNIQINFVDQKT
jgi:hypothetical protein